MSGHSKWSTIKHKKEALDSKRGKLFSQLSKNIRVATKFGKSGDPKSNSALRLAIEKARAANMSNDIINRAIDRGLGKGKGGQIEEVVYEGFGPGGVGLLVVALTENKQRTAAEMKNIFSKHGGSLGSPGSAKYLFERSIQTNDYQCVMPMQVENETTQKQIEALIDSLLENEDVEDVYSNANWPGMVLKDEEVSS